MAVAAKAVEVEDIDLGWKAIKKEVRKLGRARTDIGQFGSGGKPDVDIAARAAVQEFGTRDGRVPSRPFHRQTFKKNLNELKKEIDKAYDMLIARNISAALMVRGIGEWYTGKMKETITDGKFKSLAPATVRAKKSSRPLIDTGDMRRFTTHKEKL